MPSITYTNLRVNNAEQFKNMVTQNTNIYLAYGKTGPWSNDASPDTPNTSISSVYDFWNKMIGAKKITGNDIRHAIPRNNWVANTVYTAYDDQATNLFDANTKFYVLTSAFSIYKCISNNYSAISTVEPSAINPDNITQTSDGYIWKFMYNLSDQDLLRYTSENYIPVKALTSTDGSLQWSVQQAAVDGSILNIILSNKGTGYTNTANITVTVTGDGSGLQATANINTTAQIVDSITVTSQGKGYTSATVNIVGGGGSGAMARAIISPPGGHGSKPLYELGGGNIMLNPQLIRDEGGILPVTNDYRKIALLLQPLLNDGVTLASNTAIFQGYTIATTGTGDYLPDEMVYQGPSLSESTFSGTLLTWDTANGIAQLIGVSGTPAAGTLVGANSATTRFLTSSKIGDLAKYSGQILYVDNLSPIIRASDQTESFQILLKF